MNDIKSFVKNNAPTILTIAGCVGTIVTTVLGINAGMKIADIYMDKDELDKAEKKEVIKACVPALISCGVTIGCNVSADILNRHQKSDLMAMCALIGSSYSGYRKEVINRYGEEVDKDIVDTVSRYSNYHIMAPEIPDKLCHWIVDMGVDGLPTWELDALERDILHAEMHVNRNYILGMPLLVSDLLEFLDVDDPSNLSERYGWAMNDSEIYYVDFEHEKIDENTFRLYPVFTPWKDPEFLDIFGNEY